MSAWPILRRENSASPQSTGELRAYELQIELVRYFLPTVHVKCPVPIGENRGDAVLDRRNHPLHRDIVRFDLGANGAA
jgi:hypothetical protein